MSNVRKKSTLTPNEARLFHEQALAAYVREGRARQVIAAGLDDDLFAQGSSGRCDGLFDGTCLPPCQGTTPGAYFQLLQRVLEEGTTEGEVGVTSTLSSSCGCS